MSINYIIDEVAKIEDLEKRKKETDRLAKCLEDRLPYGGHNPPFYPGDTERETIKRWAIESEADFARLKELCGGEFPEFLKEYYAAYQRRREHTERLLSLDSKKSRRQNICDYFPYWDDFNRFMHKKFDNVKADIDVSKLRFLPKLIGKGGFAEVYAIITEGKQDGDYDYALKLFFPSFMHQADFERPYVRKRVNRVIKNLQLQEEFLKQEPFVQIHAREWRGDSWETEWAYIMDYVRGQDVKEMIEKNPEVFRDKQLTGNILLTYAKTLNLLHKNGRVFVDNSLDAIIVGDTSIKICDVDNIIPITELEEGHSPYHLHYSTREQVLEKKPSYSSDLEAFALMIHHLLFKKPLLGTDWEDRTQNKQKAEENKRVYLKEFQRRLPKQLSLVVSALINYPRDDSITAEDFISAIKEDYGI